MKTYLLHAAYKQGMTPHTAVTALADAAHNVLQPAIFLLVVVTSRRLNCQRVDR